MSPGSLRNFIKRVEKKERQAPARLGPGVHLERHKDYKARSAARHARDDLMHRMELEASMKNPDEFYHAMENLRTRQGVRVRPGPALAGDANDAIPEINLQMAEKAERKRIQSLQALLPAQPAQRVVLLAKQDIRVDSNTEINELIGKDAHSDDSQPGTRLLAAYAALAARRATSVGEGQRALSGDALEPHSTRHSESDSESSSPATSPDSGPEPAALTPEEIQRIRKEIEESRSRIRKIRKELGRRDAERLRQKSGPFYGKKRDVGNDEYGNPMFQIKNCRRR